LRAHEQRIVKEVAQTREHRACGRLAEREPIGCSRDVPLLIPGDREPAVPLRFPNGAAAGWPDD
jgi:hypothetical protein